MPEDIIDGACCYAEIKRLEFYFRLRVVRLFLRVIDRGAASG